MPLGEPFIHLVEVDSTNNYAIRQVQAHLADHGTAWLADIQTEGKGRRGKAWFSEPGENILLSCLIKPEPLSVTSQFVLSAAMALACHDLLKKCLLPEITIKWPNDLYSRDRKAGGILIENILQGQDWKYAVVGIGINVNQSSFPSSLQNPVSIYQVTGKKFDVPALAKELCKCLEERWDQVCNGNGDSLLKSYNSLLYKLNKEGNFKHAGANLKGIVKGINTKGELNLDIGGGEVVSYSHLEWLIEKDTSVLFST